MMAPKARSEAKQLKPRTPKTRTPCPLPRISGSHVRRHISCPSSQYHFILHFTVARRSDTDANAALAPQRTAAHAWTLVRRVRERGNRQQGWHHLEDDLCGSMLGSTLQPRNRVLKAEPSRAQSRLHARRREHSRPDLESHAERRKRVDQPRHPQRTRRWLLGRWDLAKIGEHLEEYGVGEGQSQGSRSTRVRGCEGVRV